MIIQQLKILSSTSLLLLETGGGRLQNFMPRANNAAEAFRNKGGDLTSAPLASLNKGAASTKQRGGQQKGQSGAWASAALRAVLVSRHVRASLRRWWLIRLTCRTSEVWLHQLIHTCFCFLFLSCSPPMCVSHPFSLPVSMDTNLNLSPAHLSGVNRIIDGSLYAKFKIGRMLGLRKATLFQRMEQQRWGKVQTLPRRKSFFLLLFSLRGTGVTHNTSDSAVPPALCAAIRLNHSLADHTLWQGKIQMINPGSLHLWAHVM